MSNGFIQYAKAIADMKLGVKVTQQMIDDGYDLSIDMAMTTLEFVLSTMVSPRGNQHCTPLDYIRCSQLVWEDLCDYIESVDSTKTCQKFTLLLVCNTMITEVRSKIGDENTDAMIAAIQQVIKERGDVLFKDPVQSYPSMTDEEIDEVVNNCDPNLLKEFFDAFQKVEVFYADPSKYDTDEKKELQHKMLAIYNKMLK